MGDAARSTADTGAAARLAGHAFFFERGGAALHGFLHAAAGARARTMGVVLVHPFMEEKHHAHLVYRDLAVRLAARGHPTLRFDLYGHGESEGEWEDATIERWLDDVEGAADELRRRAGTTALMLAGLRFGATLAALAARRLRPARLALWHPVVRGDAYAMELLRAHLASELVLHRRLGVTREALVERLARGAPVNLFGYPYTPAQHRALAAIDLARELPGAAARALVVDLVRLPSARATPELAALAEGAGATLARAVEPVTLYALGQQHCARAHEATDVTLRWLEA